MFLSTKEDNMSRYRLTDIAVDEIIRETEKSWEIRLGETTAYLPFSTCEQIEDLQFVAPQWLVDKIQEASGLAMAA
jgi:hypothetical protein